MSLLFIILGSVVATLNLFVVIRMFRRRWTKKGQIIGWDLVCALVGLHVGFVALIYEFIFEGGWYHFLSKPIFKKKPAKVVTPFPSSIH